MGKRKFMTPVEIVALAVLVLMLVIWLLWPKTAGVQVVVMRSGEELGYYDMDTPVRIPVQGVNGFSLIVVVEGGAVHVEGSTCPDLICQNHAPIVKTGESIICLPGQVTVTVKGGVRRGQDALAG